MKPEISAPFANEVLDIIKDSFGNEGLAFQRPITNSADERTGRRMSMFSSRIRSDSNSYSNKLSDNVAYNVTVMPLDREDSTITADRIRCTVFNQHNIRNIENISSADNAKAYLEYVPELRPSLFENPTDDSEEFRKLVSKLCEFTIKRNGFINNEIVDVAHNTQFSRDEWDAFKFRYFTEIDGQAGIVTVTVGWLYRSIAFTTY